MKRNIVAAVIMALMLALAAQSASVAAAKGAQLLQPSSDGTGFLSPTTTEISSTQNGLDINIASGTIGLAATVTVNLANTDANTLVTATSVDSIDTKITACNTGAVVVSTSALPAGASTLAAQTSGNATLTTIDGKITACNTGAVVVSSGSVNVGTVTTLPAITGTVTANAGTNLNTSTLALESGGNVESAATSAASIAVDADSIDTNTAPLTTIEQITSVTVAAGATGSIACSATSSAAILAVTGATGAIFYSYTGDATTDPRMIMFQNEKMYTPEGHKYEVKTFNLYNPTAADGNFYLECGR